MEGSVGQWEGFPLVTKVNQYLRGEDYQIRKCAFMNMWTYPYM